MASVTVGTTAVRLTSASRSGGRNAIDVTVQNLGAADVYIGTDNTVTVSGATGGIKLAASGGAFGLSGLSDEADLYGISGSAGNDVRVLEA